MRLISLDLKNIGPFDEAHLDFLEGPDDPVPVTFITGENGTGKSIILDAIRGLFGPGCALLERRIIREQVPFAIRSEVVRQGHRITLESREFDPRNGGWFLPLHEDFSSSENGPKPYGDVMDYWRPGSASGSFEISTFTPPDPDKLLYKTPLQGTLRNGEVTNLICFFDYLRDSRTAEEKNLGDRLYEVLEKIIRACVLDGELDRVERSSFTPIVKQSGQLVPIANLSAGNIYLIQRLVGLLAKMYAAHKRAGTPLDRLCEAPGLLLIDEAESHLHPRWQKRLIRDILSVFPNLQIITTTHSPFILASTPGARVFGCRYDQEAGCCVIEQQHDSFANKPVDEVVLSAAFDGTQPFGPEITALLEQRTQAAAEGDEITRRRIEQELQRLNPQYFGFFDVEERLRILGGGG